MSVLHSGQRWFGNIFKVETLQKTMNDSLLIYFMFVFYNWRQSKSIEWYTRDRVWTSIPWITPITQLVFIGLVFTGYLNDDTALFVLYIVSVLCIKYWISLFFSREFGWGLLVIVLTITTNVAIVGDLIVIHQWATLGTFIPYALWVFYLLLLTYQWYMYKEEVPAKKPKRTHQMRTKVLSV